MHRKLNRASPTPIYQQIANLLHADIKGGQLAPGGRLPSERQLAADFKVSVLTIRQAIAQLRTAGLVVAEQGKGVFVRERPKVRRLARNRMAREERRAGLGAFMTDAAAHGFTATAEVDVREDVADERTAEELGIAPGEAVIVRERRHLADGRPVQISNSRLPRSITAGTPIEEVDTGPGGSYARLEDLGFRYVGYDEIVGAREATPEEAAALHLRVGAPVLTVTRLASFAKAEDDDTGHVIEINDIVIDPEFYELVYRMPAD